MTVAGHHGEVADQTFEEAEAEAIADMANVSACPAVENAFNARIVLQVVAVVDVVDVILDAVADSIFIADDFVADEFVVVGAVFADTLVVDVTAALTILAGPTIVFCLVVVETAETVHAVQLVVAVAVFAVHATVHIVHDVVILATCPTIADLRRQHNLLHPQTVPQVLQPGSFRRPAAVLCPGASPELP